MEKSYSVVLAIMEAMTISASLVLNNFSKFKIIFYLWLKDKFPALAAHDNLTPMGFFLVVLDSLARFQ